MFFVMAGDEQDWIALDDFRTLKPTKRRSDSRSAECRTPKTGCLRLSMSSKSSGRTFAAGRDQDGCALPY